MYSILLSYMLLWYELLVIKGNPIHYMKVLLYANHYSLSVKLHRNWLKIITILDSLGHNQIEAQRSRSH